MTGLGVGSGLDLAGLRDKLLAIEARPETNRLNRVESELQSKTTALNTFKTALSDFNSALSGLRNINTFQKRNVSSSDSTVVTASTTNAASAGTHTVKVDALATAHRISSGAFTTISDDVGTGTLTFQYGTFSAGLFSLNADKPTQTVSIPAGKNTLQGVRDAVNAANIGVNASIVNDGTGYKLVFNSKETGAANSLKVTVADSSDVSNTDNAGLSRLAYNPEGTLGNGKNLSQNVEAVNANVTVNGILLSKSSNTLNDVLEGVTLNLLKADVGVTKNVTISQDKNGATKSVQGFVEAYNKLVDAQKQLSGFDSETKKAGPLAGDFTVQYVQGRVRALLGDSVGNLSSNVKSLADIGIKTEKGGTLSLNTSTLQKALDTNFDDVGKIFAPIGKTTDSEVTYVSSTNSTKAGNYAVNVTQLATRGKAVGNAVAPLTIVAADNDILTGVVNGVSGTITLTAKTYTADELAAEIQSKFNGLSSFKSKGITVSVTQSSGILTITSDKYGSGSTVSSITNANGAAIPLFGGTPVSTAGVDVAGTINGATATGSGQDLSGTGSAVGLKLKITGTLTGSRGSVDFTRGIADTLTTFLDTQLDSKSSLTSRINSIGKQITSLNVDRERLNTRLESIQKRLTDQFSRLDSLISKLNADSNFLKGQFDSLSKK